MKTITRWMVVRASGDTRIVTRKPTNLRLDEVAFKLVVQIPDSWGKVVGELEINMPEPPEAEITQE